jgi:chromosome segregation ATPase
MPANVQSIESLRDFRARLLIFQEKVNDSLMSMQEQVYHAMDWIERDRPRYWHQAELKAFDQISQARVALETARMRTETDGFRPSLIQEKQAIRDAKTRLAFCQEKIRILQAMISRVHHEADEFRGRLSQMQRLVETDLPKMVGLLDSMVKALEAYTEVVSKEDGGDDLKAPPTRPNPLKK